VTLPESEVQAAIDRLVTEGQVVALGRGGPAGYLIRADTLARITGDIQALLETYHRRQPLRRGMAKEEVRSRTGLPARVFEEIVAHGASTGALVDDGETLRLPGHEITFTPEQRGKIDRYLAALRAAPYTPPGPAEFGIDPEVAIALAETGEVVRVDEGIIFARETFEEIQRQVLEIIDREGRITLAQFRDHFGSSRKYAQAVLEYLDHQRVTRRVGDERVRYHSA